FSAKRTGSVPPLVFQRIYFSALKGVSFREKSSIDRFQQTEDWCQECPILSSRDTILLSTHYLISIEILLASEFEPGFNQCKPGLKCGIRIQIGGVEQVCIRSLPKRRDRPAAVGCVTRIDFCEDLVLVAENPEPFQFQPPPVCTNIRPRVDEQLGRRIRRYHGSDVAAVHHRA